MLQYLSKLLYLLKGSETELIQILVVFLITSILEALGIGLIGPFLNLASSPEKINQIAFLSNLYKTLGFLNSNTEFIALIGILIAIVFCIKSVVYFFSKWYIFKFSYDQHDKLVNRLIKSYLSLPYDFFLSRNTASLIKNTVIETGHFTFLCMLPLLDAIVNFIITIALIILLAKTDSLILVVTLGILAPTFLLFNALSAHFKRWGKIASESQHEMVRTINHGLGGFKETKVLGCEPYFEYQIEGQARAYARAATLSQSFQMLPRVSIEALLVIFLVLFVSISLMSPQRNFQDLVSVLGVFSVAGMRLVPSSSLFLQSLAKLKSGSHTLDVLYFDLKEIETYSDRNDHKAMPKQSNINIDDSRHKSVHTLDFQNQIELNSVTYRYPNADKPTLKNLSLVIKKGQSIAFIGKSGAGKTTLVDLILGLLIPESGDIRIDGVSGYQNLRAWQNLVGYIPQSIFLTDDTIERNIAFGVPDLRIDQARLQQAISAAQLKDFISTLPDGVNTIVGERGVRLSGGQRQRIGIARALYHQREILVLDEATSALDSETEQLVSQAINALAGTKTLIIIAHRLSTIQQCDYVYMLQEGQIIKSGKYEEVIAAPH
jgi:ATP-binding cassette, subfamily B, bacterial PglK